MDFSLERLNNEKIRYFHSERDSRIHLLFVPGLFNAELWKQQFRYFSKRYSTTLFDVWRNDRSFERQQVLLEQLLNYQELENVVLAGAGLGNSLVQAAEHKENVIATVLTGVAASYQLVPGPLYRSIWKAAREPKIAKKIFFSESADYRTVRKFVKDVEVPRYREYRSFAENYSMRKPVKNSLMVHAEDDRFSSEDFMEQLKSESLVACIKSAGTFSFYEKPQEYNKALTDFLKKIKPFVRDQENSMAREENRSLEDFTPVIK